MGGVAHFPHFLNKHWVSGPSQKRTEGVQGGPEKASKPKIKTFGKGAAHTPRITFFPICKGGSFGY